MGNLVFNICKSQNNILKVNSEAQYLRNRLLTEKDRSCQNFGNDQSMAINS